jgi:hypothetical protein
LTFLAAGLIAGPCSAQQSLSTALASQQSVSPAFGPELPAIIPDVDQTALSAALSEAYSSNVSGGSTALAAVRGLVPSDFLTTPYISAVISRPLGRESYFLQGTLGYVDYARNPVLNRSNIQVQGGGAAPFGVCQSSLIGSYSRGQAKLEELALAEANTTGLARTSDLVQDGAVSMTATCGHAVGLAPTFTVSEILINNSAANLEDINARVFSTSGGIQYRSAAYGSLSVIGQYSRTDYPDRFVLTPSGIRSQSLENFGGGLTYVTFPFARLQGSASIDYEILQPVSATGQNFYGFTYDFTLAYLVTPRLSTAVTVSRQTTPSNSPYALFEVRELYNAQANYSLGTLTTLILSASRQHMVYDDLVALQRLDATVITDSRLTASAERQIGRRLSVSLSVAYRQRDANYPGLSYPDVLTQITARSKF